MSKKKLSKKKRYTWWLHRATQLIFAACVIVLVFFAPGMNRYLQMAPVVSSVRPAIELAIPTPAAYPLNTSGIYPGSEITATGVVIVDVDSGVFLYKRNEDLSLSPASTTKILTAMVILDSFQLDDVVTVRSVNTEGQLMGLVAGERITIENLLYGALIHSGNDAAWALAESYPGGSQAFILAMNQKAKLLHLTKSFFTNPAGFDDPNHKMTPTDLARLATYALQNKTIAKMVAIPQITVSDVTHTYFHPLKNVNELLGKIPGVGGIKTGWTEEAGENLVTLVERGGHRVILVILRSQDRFGETSQLIDWVFGNHKWQKFAPPS